MWVYTISLIIFFSTSLPLNGSLKNAFTVHVTLAVAMEIIQNGAKINIFKAYNFGNFVSELKILFEIAE